MKLTQYQEIIVSTDLPSVDIPLVLFLLIERLNLEIVRESTPDYTSYEIRAAHGQSAAEEGK